MDSFGPGAVLAGRYRIEVELGRGGFGAVYRAFDTQSARAVAVKVLHPEIVATPDGRIRFSREADLARRLSHPNTVFIYDFGTDGDVSYIVFELLEGQPLSRLIAGTTGLAPERVARIARQILGALGEAHALGIIHRDVKPANVFIAEKAGERDFVKLLDFGIAKDLSVAEATQLTQTGQAMGTPAYMALEQLKGQPATVATDLYAVGLVMAEMIQGAKVFPGSAVEIITQQLTPAPTPLSPAVLQHALGPIILRATQKEPTQRYRSATEMMADLDRAAMIGQAPPAPLEPPTALAAHPALVAHPGHVAHLGHVAHPAPDPQGWRPAVGAMRPPMRASQPASQPAPSTSLGVWLGIGVVLVVVGGLGAWALLTGDDDTSASASTKKNPEKKKKSDKSARGDDETEADDEDQEDGDRDEDDEPRAEDPDRAEEREREEQASKRRRAWIDGPLKGNDNPVAAMRTAKIFEADGATRVTINNQFGFTCTLVFSEEGRPAKLSKCNSREGWGAQTSSGIIELTCEETSGQEVCQGPYSLVSPSGFSDRGVMLIARPLEPGAKASAPPTPPPPFPAPVNAGPPVIPPAPPTPPPANEPVDPLF
jgi:serine/threonine protein kinase